MKVLWNPTNEDMLTEFGGVHLELKGVCDEYPEGHQVKVEDARANHILNNFGRRGLVALEYGDDQAEDGKKSKKEHKRESALSKNKEFKLRQIAVYNQQNEARANAKMGPLEPTEQVRGYAKELGVKILEPYSTIDPESSENAELKKENKELKKQMAVMSDQMGEILDRLREKDIEPPEVPTFDDEKLNAMRRKFRQLGKPNFEGWLKNNKDEVLAYPEVILNEIKEKYKVVYDKQFPFPT